MILPCFPLDKRQHQHDKELQQAGLIGEEDWGQTHAPALAQNHQSERPSIGPTEQKHGAASWGTAFTTLTAVVLLTSVYIYIYISLVSNGHVVKYRNIHK